LRGMHRETREAVSGNTRLDLIRFTGDDYPGEGESRGYSRGVLVFSGLRNLTGEGMGIGSIAIRKGRYTYFPSRHTTGSGEEGILERTFYLDTWRKWAWRGRPSSLLTRSMETAARCYMAVPPVQSLLFLRSPLYRALSINPMSELVPPVAIARFRYDFRKNGIAVSCDVWSGDNTLPRIFILNELDGGLFCRSVRDGSPRPPPSGWQRCRDPGAGLLSPDQDLVFRVSDIAVEGDAAWSLYWGREHTSSLRWAGFEIVIDPARGARGVRCSYLVRIERYGDSGGLP
jgi:hypothetical protein